VLLEQWERIAKDLSGSNPPDDADSLVVEAVQCANIFAVLINVTKSHVDKQVRAHQPTCKLGLCMQGQT